MQHESRVDLLVPFVEKEDAKALGARWDARKKLWYAPPGADVQGLKRWLPKNFRLPPVDDGTTSESTGPDPGAERGITLTELLFRVKAVIDRELSGAEWVRAEISELRVKNGHLYLSLAERNERGDVLAKTSAVIWRDCAEIVARKFV